MLIYFNFNKKNPFDKNIRLIKIIMKATPIIALDAIVQFKNSILLIQRLHEPFVKQWAFPGGRMDYGETPEFGCLRELHEETNLMGKISWLVGIYGEPDRDPRKHTVSLTYAVSVQDFSTLKAGDDAGDANFFEIDDLLKNDFVMAFDHKKILMDYLKIKEIKSF